MNKGLHFPLFSDCSVEVSESFGLAFHMDDEIVAMYLEKFNINLEEASGETHHNLPVPAVFVLGADGKVKFVYTNPDHTTRLSNEELLAVAT